MNIALQVFLMFAKIGLFTFGGGYAMISIIEHNCVEQKKWITHDEMMNITVIAESTPGPIAINCATYVGYKQGGLLGAIAASVGVVLPSFVIIFAISMFLNRFLEIAIIANAFRGIKLAVGLLIFNAGLNMFKKSKKSLLSTIITFAAMAIMLLIDIFSINFSSIALMLAAAVVSLGLFVLKGAPEAKEGGAKK